jgi:hypothetical protein
MALLSIILVSLLWNGVIGQSEVSSLALDEMIGGALAAVVGAQATSADIAMNFILSTFNQNTDGSYSAKSLNFQYQKSSTNGTASTRQIQIPLLTLIPIPMMIVDGN